MKVTQSCPTLCNPTDYRVHGILQARTLEWVAFPFSRGSSRPRDRTQVSRIAGRFFTSWARREDQEHWGGWPIPSPADLPDPGIKPGSPALQVDSSPTELSGKTQKRILAPRCSDPPAKKLHKAREGSQGPRERVQLLWGIEGLVQPLSQALMPTRGSKGGKDSSAVTLSTGQLRGLCQEDAQDVPWDFSTCWRRAQSWTKNQHICNWEWEPNTEKLHYQTHQLIFPPWDNSERQQTGDKDAAQSLSS